MADRLVDQVLGELTIPGFATDFGEHHFEGGIGLEIQAVSFFLPAEVLFTRHSRLELISQSVLDLLLEAHQLGLHIRFDGEIVQIGILKSLDLIELS